MDITVVGTHEFSGKPERAPLNLSAGFESDAKDEAMRATTALVNQRHEEFLALKAARPSPITWFAVLPIRTRSWRPYHDKGKVLRMVIARAAGAADVVAMDIADPGLLRDVGSSAHGGYGAVASRALGGQEEDIQFVPEDIEVRATVHARFRAVK